VRGFNATLRSLHTWVMIVTGLLMVAICMHIGFQ
jgi:hypothetical protein